MYYRMLAILFVALFLSVSADAARLKDDKPKSDSATTDKPPPESLPKPPPSVPPSPGVVQAAMQRGIAFLLKDQNKDGSWGSPTGTKPSDIYVPAPEGYMSFRAAVTALSVSALIETGGDSPEVRQAIERGETYLLENLPKIRRDAPDTLYNVWTHAYGIQALVRMHRRLPDDVERKKKIEEVIRTLIGYLGRYESVDGGWGYYDFKVGAAHPATDAISFTTSTVLIALAEAKSIGVEPPEKLVQRAVDSVKRQRKPDFSYLYGEYLKWRPFHEINRPAGSLGRSQVCNLALRMWGDDKVTNEIVKVWLDRLMARNLWLDMGRKRPIPHESWFAVAAYFYYYGHYYAAHCIELLPVAERPFYQDHLANILLPKQEKDGSWWDFPMFNYHKPYGTAFVLMSLKRCLRTTGEANSAGGDAANGKGRQP